MCSLAASQPIRRSSKLQSLFKGCCERNRGQCAVVNERRAEEALARGRDGDALLTAMDGELVKCFELLTLAMQTQMDGWSGSAALQHRSLISRPDDEDEMLARHHTPSASQPFSSRQMGAQRLLDLRQKSCDGSLVVSLLACLLELLACLACLFARWLALRSPGCLEQGYSGE